MKKFDDVIKKINFKKVAVTYVITAIAAGLVSLSFLSIVFKEKIALAWNYASISEKVEHNKLGVNAVINDLSGFAAKSTDIADILILDRSNNITFSAKNSLIAQSGQLSLKPIQEKKYKYLLDTNDSNIIFGLIKEDALMLTKAIFVDGHKIEKNYNDDYFYETNFNDKEFYTLSYVTDKATGDKIYFISDIKPVKNAEFYLEMVGALAMLFFMIYWVLIALWVYSNAIKSKLNYVLWGIITLFTNLAGLFVYLIYKQNNQTCFKCGAVQPKGNTFCTSCGTKINDTCTYCNAVIKAQDTYCHHCGEELHVKL